MRKIDAIVVHCSATAEGKDFHSSDINRWHKARGFNEIGYHFVITLDGSVENGRDLEKQGAHCSQNGMNRRSIGICYIGGYDKDGKTPKDTRTPMQRVTLRKLLTKLKGQFPEIKIYGHRDFSSKACPSFDATGEYADI